MDIEYPDGKIKTFPELKSREESISVRLINKKLGTNLTGSEVSHLLTKMSLKSELEKDEIVRVTIPATRQDILHPCDIIEDVGIAFGYNNIKKTLPNALTIGHQLPLNKVTDQLRFEIARCGYTEALTFALVSSKQKFDSSVQNFDSSVQNFGPLSNHCNNVPIAVLTRRHKRQVAQEEWLRFCCHDFQSKNA